jgi:predicted RNA-binding Zn-ribbon protein involved in translation (DUF1610 family)
VTFYFIKDTYDKLGNFIHVPVLTEHRKAQREKYLSGHVRRYLLEGVVPAIERLCQSTLDANFKKTMDFKCPECENIFRRSERSLKYFKEASCPFCNAEYDVGFEEGKAYIMVKVIPFECPDCQSVTDIKKYQTGDSMDIICNQCHSRFILQEKVWSVTRA